MRAAHWQRIHATHGLVQSRLSCPVYDRSRRASGNEEKDRHSTTTRNLKYIEMKNKEQKNEAIHVSRSVSERKACPFGPLGMQADPPGSRAVRALLRMSSRARFCGQRTQYRIALVLVAVLTLLLSWTLALPYAETVAYQRRIPLIKRLQRRSMMGQSCTSHHHCCRPINCPSVREKRRECGRLQGAEHLMLIIPSDEGERQAQAMENFFQACASDEAFSLELVGTRREQGFVLRASSAEQLLLLSKQFAAQYPQAELQRIAPTADPLVLHAGRACGDWHDGDDAKALDATQDV